MDKKPHLTTLLIGDFPHPLPRRPGIEIREARISDAKKQTLAFMTLLKQADIVITRGGLAFDASLIAKAPKLKLLMKAGAGTDAFDRTACAKRGIIIENTPGQNAQSVAELAIGLLLDLSRHISCADRGMRAGKWLKKSCVGSELWGTRSLIIGYGHIGRRTAAILKNGFGVAVSIYDPTLTLQEQDAATVAGHTLVRSLTKALPQADSIILHPSLTDTSRNLITKKIVTQMKPGVFVINSARARIARPDALVWGLKRGIIAGLGIDAWHEDPPRANPFKKFDNVVMTPHIGGNTTEALRRVTNEAIKTVYEYAHEN